MTLRLQKPETDFVRGGFLSVTWDIEETEMHKKEIDDGKAVGVGILLETSWRLEADI
jgi:hypothetical protein